jgi:hypothetical protein
LTKENGTMSRDVECGLLARPGDEVPRRDALRRGQGIALLLAEQNLTLGVADRTYVPGARRAGPHGRDVGVRRYRVLGV